MAMVIFLLKNKKADNALTVFERDAPFDVAQEWEGSRFAGFYLEQTNQQSNIYFEQYQREQAAKRVPFIGRTRLLSSAIFLCMASCRRGTFGGVLLVAVLGAAWWWSPTARTAPAFSDAREAYETFFPHSNHSINLISNKRCFYFMPRMSALAARALKAAARLCRLCAQCICFSCAVGNKSGGGRRCLSARAGGSWCGRKLAQGMEPLFQVSFFSLSHEERV